MRAELVTRRIGYVLAVAKDHRIRTGIGTRPATDLAARPPRRAWQRLSAGHGAKGHRWYDWALVDTSDPAADPDGAGRHWLLIRCQPNTGELAFYRAYSPAPVPLADLVRVAATRWTIEESFQSGKELAALDEHQLRRWASWHRWTILAMRAHAFLSVMTATEPPPDSDTELISLTRNEIRRLFIDLLTRTVRTANQILHWSRWRRRHQSRAQASHYRRQATQK